MHPKDSGREAFCRYKLAGIRALMPEACVGLDDVSVDRFDLERRQALLEVLEKLVIDLSHTERLAFAKDVGTYRQWTAKKLRITAEQAHGLKLGGVGYETLSRAVELSMPEPGDSVDRKRVGDAYAKRLLELACFHLERHPCLHLVVMGSGEDAEDASEQVSESVAERPVLYVVR